MEVWYGHLQDSVTFYYFASAKCHTVFSKSTHPPKMPKWCFAWQSEYEYISLKSGNYVINSTTNLSASVWHTCEKALKHMEPLRGAPWE